MLLYKFCDCIIIIYLKAILNPPCISDIHSTMFHQFSCSVVSNSLRPHESQYAGLPVHHQLPEFTQTHVHRVSDAIQPSHPLSSPSPPAPNPSQHPSLGFSRQEHWNGLPFASPGNIPDPRMESTSPALAGGFFTTKPPGKPNKMFC